MFASLGAKEKRKIKFREVENMTKLERLYDLAYERNIVINDFHYSDTGKGMCVHDGDYKSIALDMLAFETSGEECAVLGEELGHYETGTLYLLEATINSPIYKSNERWCEGKAKTWKIKELLPFNELKEAYNRYRYLDDVIWELSEYFGFPEDFICEALEYYTERRGLSLGA